MDGGPGNGDQATTAGYRVKERVFGVGADTATGRTHDVTGSVTVAGQRVTAAEFTVDMATLKSNKSLRDAVLKTAAIDTNKFPTAAFTLSDPIALPDITPGKVYTVDARGKLRLHGVSKSVSVTLRYEQTKTGFVLLADMPIVMADYSIKAPSVAGVVSVDDHGSFELLSTWRNGRPATRTEAGRICAPADKPCDSCAENRQSCRGDAGERGELASLSGVNDLEKH